MLSDNDIQRIVSRIVAGIDPVAVGIFGSYAVGRAHEGSDLDLFVIQHTVLPGSARRRNVTRHLYGVLHPLDVHVFTPDEFEAGMLEELSFAWVIVRQARLYYQSSDMLAKVPSLRRE
ncbi:MAG: nucleotidyltransferase domain-containing protein [Rhodoferax sp.]